MTQIDTRAALPADIPDLLAMVERLAVHHGDTPGVSEASLHRDLFGADPWLVVLLARHDGRPMGYAALFGTAYLHFGARGMELHHLFTEAEARGLGVGQALIGASVALARDRGCTFMTVGTHPENLAAQAFYPKLGFERRDGAGPRFLLRL
ncbi:GNAT family N-acetyltransferase [Chachezhania sediminis]|uniref:GNAT family N-acetyltransferase n=1 Tax=Chachezhania sediminis TaxID=2599291 RepID=UPI00131D5C6F